MTTTHQDDDTFAAEQAERRAARKLKRTATIGANTKRAQDAADVLGAAGAGALDVHLLRELVVDSNKHWIRFVLPCGRHVTLERRTLRRVTTEAKRNPRMRGFAPWIDDRGLRLRWLTGGLLLVSQFVEAQEDMFLVVPFSAAASSAA
jgi:hypothetical protein